MGCSASSTRRREPRHRTAALSQRAPPPRRWRRRRRGPPTLQWCPPQTGSNRAAAASEGPRPPPRPRNQRPPAEGPFRRHSKRRRSIAAASSRHRKRLLRTLHPPRLAIPAVLASRLPSASRATVVASVPGWSERPLAFARLRAKTAPMGPAAPQRLCRAPKHTAGQPPTSPRWRPHGWRQVWSTGDRRRHPGALPRQPDLARPAMAVAPQSMPTLRQPFLQ
mmetsp:Transcript_11251/g.30079  ORF Transcript_11251/g.30079 Transcript_11251/m.30079 type:complete len:222 (+) Transcript_11251:980-1645(+)